MPIAELNQFVYGLHAEMERVKAWANQAHDAIGDHASRLAALRNK